MPSLLETNDQLPIKTFGVVLFCDIRGFSSLFDDRDPLEALKFGNTVLSELGGVVEANRGTIDKFTGDGFMAHFGVVNGSEILFDNLFARADLAKDACRAVIEMRSALMRLNQTRHFDDQWTVEAGIGIHCGDVAAGFINTKSKSEFTILGSTVNVASRIESLTKEFSVDCLVTEEVMNLVKQTFDFHEMPKRMLRGIKTQRTSYWLLPTNL